MYYLIYRSFATQSFADDELQTLLAKSKRNNQQREITGFLYYFSQSFIQLIEGDEITVKALYQRILSDSRHRDRIILKEGYIATRFYPDWTMGYRFLSPEEVKQAALYPTKDGVINKNALLRLFNIANAK